MHYLGKTTGFAQRTYTHVDPTPYLADNYYDTGLWRSPVTQQAIRKDLFEFKNLTKKPSDLLLQYAIHKTERDFRLSQPVQMIHLNDIFQEELEIWSRSPGLPWRDLGYKTKNDIRRDPDAIRRVRKFWHLVKDGRNISPPDSLAYVRSHTCERGTTKVRAIWGYPATMTFGEAMFALPLIRAYQQQNNGPIAYGYETFNGGAAKVCRRFNKHKTFVGLDFKKFDKTVPAWLVREAFQILMMNIDFTKYRDYGTAQFNRNLWMFQYIMEYFINTPIRLANGVRLRKSNGIASGSYFTSLVGSICNAIFINWTNLRHLGRPEDYLVFGDDSFFSTDAEFDLDKVAADAQLIGMELNYKKSQVSTNLYNIQFLGYYLGEGKPWKPHDAWMTALHFPEAPDKSFADVQSRAVGLYYANMCVDEHFANLCRGIVQAKQFDLALSANLQRMLSHIGIAVKDVDPITLPDPSYFFKRMHLI